MLICTEANKKTGMCKVKDRGSCQGKIVDCDDYKSPRKVDNAKASKKG